jgi:hypothetical protein
MALRDIIRDARVQGEKYGDGINTRYKKDVHTGFRGFCFSQ